MTTIAVDLILDGFSLLSFLDSLDVLVGEGLKGDKGIDYTDLDLVSRSIGELHCKNAIFGNICNKTNLLCGVLYDISILRICNILLKFLKSLHRIAGLQDIILSAYFIIS